MIKFDKTFRISDTPHLNTCYTLCDNDQQCKIVAFGLDESRGNGTCMLSAFEADAKDLTLFEPRFNLYSRKRDCHAIPQPGETSFFFINENQNTLFSYTLGHYC